MQVNQIIRAAIPEANESECDYILWNMTSFPFGNVTAKMLYKAASRTKRASNNNIMLCDLCDSKIDDDNGWVCQKCRGHLNNFNKRCE